MTTLPLFIIKFTVQHPQIVSWCLQKIHKYCGVLNMVSSQHIYVLYSTTPCIILLPFWIARHQVQRPEIVLKHPHSTDSAIWTDKKQYSSEINRQCIPLVHFFPTEWFPEVVMLCFLIQCNPLRQTMTLDYAKLKSICAHFAGRRSWEFITVQYLKILSTEGLLITVGFVDSTFVLYFPPTRLSYFP